MKRLLRLFAATAIFATAAGCAPENPDGTNGEEPKNDVLSAPELTVTAGEGSIAFTWTSGTIE